METFDLQFRELYLTSRGVSLNKVPMTDEPVPDPLPQAAPAPVPASVARKLINPKYALVTTGTHISPTSSDQNSSNKNSNSQNPTGLKMMKARLKDVIEEPPIHPGLANLEKAYLIPYLPTWPEPDPPSDVIGFINIRDDKRANQVHLQRSERFEVSQAIRFSSPFSQPAQTEQPASHPAKAAGSADTPSANTSLKPSTPVSPTNKQLPSPAAPNTDQTDSPKQPNTPPAQDAHTPAAQTSTSPPSVTADSQPTENAAEPPQTQPVAPPVPKRRTLQLLIEPASSEKPGEAQVTLVKMDQLESLEGSFKKKRSQKEVTLIRGRLTSKDNDQDSGSNDNDSQDSTKVNCDRAVNDEPSSNSTASDEEFYDCAQPEPNNQLTNGVTTGSGRGQRQGDGLNMMARFSQSMLDLREPNQSEDSAALIRQSQQLRRQEYLSPHRHIGQVSTRYYCSSDAKIIKKWEITHTHPYSTLSMHTHTQKDALEVIWGSLSCPRMHTSMRSQGSSR